MLAMGALTLGWPIGLAVVGVAAVRARLYSTTAATALAASGPAFLVLGGPFVPVAGILSGFLFGGAQLWWAYLLWRAATHPTPQTTSVPPSTAAPRTG